MREIKFRGKSVKTNKWVYGFYAYIESDKRPVILEQDLGEYGGLLYTTIIPESVGMLTGREINDCELYCKDICSIEGQPFNYIVEWCSVTYEIYFQCLGSRSEINLCSGLEIKILGNKTDNPELLTPINNAEEVKE